MNKRFGPKRCVLSASVALSIISPVLAQQTESQRVYALDEIVVTARRTDERLSDVPQTVNVVTGETLEELRITDFSDISQVVSGISIQSTTASSGPAGSSSSVRGVPTFLLSNANPVVQFYLNDAPTGRGPDPFSTIFDIRQIEVLKGPQGTLRGRSAPTGAITLTTRKPDLYEAGGFINTSVTSQDSTNIQGAIGLPLIEGVLGVRVAGVIDDNEGNGVKSINNDTDPSSETDAYRVSLRYEPTANFSADLMYQRLETDRLSYAHVAGPGNGIDGPAIEAEDRLAIGDAPNTARNDIEFIVAQADWTVANHTLSYVGSLRDTTEINANAQDKANVVAGGDYFQISDQSSEESTHELRLSVEEPLGGIFDYTVGVFTAREEAQPLVNSVAAFLSGAYGSPYAPPVAGNPHPRYTLPAIITIDTFTEELSFFASANVQLSDATELSVGGRYMSFERSHDFSITTANAFNAVGAPCAFVPVPGVVDSPVYPGACDVPVPGMTIQDLEDAEKENPFIYNLSLSHKFSEDLMAYASVGTAYRTAGASIGIETAPCCAPPSTITLEPITDLIFQESEDSITYEVGIKSSMLEDRVQLNAAIFYQDFENFYFLSQPTRYLSVTDPTNPSAANISAYEFTANADADVMGVDAEAAFLITPNWDVSANFTWSEAKLKGAAIPCNDGNFDGIPDSIVPTTQDFLDAGVAVARCQSDESISRTPRWNLAIQSEYSMSLADGLDGFVRGNYVYYPDNKNASKDITIDSYGLLNLFAGVRAADSSWEVFFFAKNIADTQQLLSRNPLEVTSGGNPTAYFPMPASGYNDVSYTPRREVGLNLRYAFGAR